MAQTEKRLQQSIATFLRQKKCYVLVVQPQSGIPDGCPDVIALLPGGGWVALEVKASATSKFQPLQKPTLKKLNDMYFARAVHPGNWPEIKKELEKIL